MSQNPLEIKPLLFIWPGNESLAQAMQKRWNLDTVKYSMRSFPDGESYLRILSPVAGRKVIVLCSLVRPNEKFLPLYFLTRALKELNADEVGLLAPYLAYLRQDKIFNPGETLTSRHFAELMSTSFDWLVTVDPHLHRYHALEEVYKIPTKVLHATGPISEWIQNHVTQPLIIGPDAESEQWVAEVARNVGGHFVVLQKIRKGDRDVEISLPALENYRSYTPVILDDIISSAHTMKKTIALIQGQGFSSPLCIGIHAVLNESTYEELLKTGSNMITCNSIEHPSNKIDLAGMIVHELNPFLRR